MNPKKLTIQMDRTTGALFLVERRFNKPVRRVVDMTAEILLALCSDLIAQEGTKEVKRNIKFGDGFAAQVSVREITQEEYDTE